MVQTTKLDYAQIDFDYRKRGDVRPYRLGERVELIPDHVAKLRNSERARKRLSGQWQIADADIDELATPFSLAMTPEQYRQAQRDAAKRSHVREWQDFIQRRQSVLRPSGEPSAASEKPATAPEIAKPVKTRQKFEGIGMTSLILALGQAGLTDRQIERGLAELNLDVASSTIAAWAKRGRLAIFTYQGPAKLTPRQLTKFKTAAGML